MSCRVPRAFYRPPTTLLLALVLLLAQALAQTHVYSHLKSAGRSDFSGTAGQICGECLSSAPLLSAAGSPATPTIALLAPGVAPLDMQPAGLVETARHYAFRSRAPPELL